VAQLIKVAGWSSEPRASVVFVHGLGGHAYDTWRRGAYDQSFWPRWLAEDIEGVSVYTLSYEAPASNWLGTAMPLGADHATSSQKRARPNSIVSNFYSTAIWSQRTIIFFWGTIPIALQS
jgi:hypothetical protein